MPITRVSSMLGYNDVNIVEDYKTQERYITGTANSERIHSNDF